MSHQPLQFGHPDDDTSASVPVPPLDPSIKPVNLDLKRDTALTITWSDARVSVYPVAYLRRRSSSAENTAQQAAAAANPLNVLPDKVVRSLGAALTAESAELVGHYAVRIRFSDGHDTGLYTWAYLRDIDPDAPRPGATPGK